MYYFLLVSVLLEFLYPFRFSMAISALKELGSGTNGSAA
jgi:hypothetical protein